MLPAVIPQYIQQGFLNFLRHTPFHHADKTCTPLMIQTKLKPYNIKKI